MVVSAGDLDKACTSDLRAHVNYGARTSQRLARGLFHAMMRFGPKLDREQLLLSRFVGIATELFAISATCSYAQHKINSGEPAEEDLVGRELLLPFGENAHRSSLCRHERTMRTARLRADPGVASGKARKLREGIV